MEKDKTFSNELAKDLKKKAIRKYALIAIAIIIAISAIFGLNIEDKNSKLPDGQGNIVTNEQSVNQADCDVTQESENSVSNDKDEIKQNDSSVANNDKSSSTTGKPSSTTGKPSAEDLAVDNSDDPTASNDGNSAYKPDDAENITVTISIRCDTLSSDMSKLTNSSIAGYIPTNGVILKTTTYKGTTDSTVFDVLNTVCRNNGIQLESTYTPLYESYYVEGINYLYEFDGGPGSGWMYKVNGWYPNYGCSSYYLSDGDVIEWVYTCDYGVDVGGTLH